MNYVYECQQFGKDFADKAGPLQCPHCGRAHEAVPCGAPPAEPGAPNVIPDHIQRRMHWGLGREIDSRSEKKRLLEEKGLTEIGAQEASDKGYQETTSMGKGYFYDGLRSRKSTAERGAVMTSDGRRVI